MKLATLLLSLVLFSEDIHQLGADDFGVRESAQRRLMAGAWLAAPACRIPFADPERARRCARVVRRAESVNLHDERWPSVYTLAQSAIASVEEVSPADWRVVTMWSYDYDSPCGMIARKLVCDARESYGGDAPDRAATRDLFAALRRVGLPRAARQSLLDWMRARERAILRTEVAWTRSQRTGR